MELYLLRHGIAMNRQARRFPHDSHRPLTPEGIKRTRKVARALAALQPGFNWVFTSPYVRAKQTADIVVEVLEIPEKLRLCLPLAPGGKSRELIAEIKPLCKEREKVLLVGHEPNLSRLASWLISGKPDTNLTLKKAGLCILETEELTAGRCASLEALLSPRLLVRLAR